MVSDGVLSQPCFARRVLKRTLFCERPGAADWSFASCDRSSCGSTCASAFPSARLRVRRRRDARRGDSAWSGAQPCDRSRSHLASTYRRCRHVVPSWVASASAGSLRAAAGSGMPVPWLPWGQRSGIRRTDHRIMAGVDIVISRRRPVSAIVSYATRICVNRPACYRTRVRSGRTRTRLPR
jgi:hypothetical protein